MTAPPGPAAPRCSSRRLRRSACLPAACPAAGWSRPRRSGTWTVLGSRSLTAEADAVAACLRRGDLPAARTQLTHLVGRRTGTLDEPEIARATVESVAENTSGHAVVAPLLWGALAGLPGLLGYRAVNTLDAMVGHHSPRYENFGWAAARADDAANYLPARLTAVLAALVAPAGGEQQRARRPGRGPRGRPPPPPARTRALPRRPSCGALGVRLGGRNDATARTSRTGPSSAAGGLPPTQPARHRPGRPAEPRRHRRRGGRVRGRRPGARKGTRAMIPNDFGLLGPARRVPGAAGAVPGAAGARPTQRAALRACCCYQR